METPKASQVTFHVSGHDEKIFLALNVNLALLGPMPQNVNSKFKTLSFGALKVLCPRCTLLRVLPEFIVRYKFGRIPESTAIQLQEYSRIKGSTASPGRNSTKKSPGKPSTRGSATFLQQEARHLRFGFMLSGLGCRIDGVPPA